MSIEPATQHGDDPSDPTTQTGQTEVDAPSTDSLAYAMFVAGYNARLTDEDDAIEFPDRETFDSYLYESFQAAYDEI